MAEWIGPCKITCPQACEVPEGAVLTEVLRPRHNWGGMVHCPNDGCERSFLVKKDGYG